jgi:hypothetical protein
MGTHEEIKSRLIQGVPAVIRSTVFLILRWVGGMDWIDLAQDRGRWWTVLNTVINVTFY